MQSYIRDVIIPGGHNVAVFQYDGLTVELAPEQLDSFNKTSQDYLDVNHTGNYFSSDMVFPHPLEEPEISDRLKRKRTFAHYDKPSYECLDVLSERELVKVNPFG